ncbi:MAG: PD-(D/E)XK nuclease family protein [Lachnospiraceae bacterium]|nr:PD-(D/E)XK nuclease family protein [Lachnospiraceae bacterium]
MGLSFYFGESGAGKSTRACMDIIKQAVLEPERNFFIIVPDQFTLQTQMDVVKLHPDKGIMNIDVLSFTRLTHRILEEVGVKKLPVLDDTGKSLVLKKCAQNIKDELPVLGNLLSKQGYIHEAKSAICEFMQYDIGFEELDKLINYSEGRLALNGKLKDLKVLYKYFLEFINDRFITTEETLGVLERNLHKSKLIKDSVVLFDGFTGFTPVQMRVLGKIMCLCRDTRITLVCDNEEAPLVNRGQHDLFNLSFLTASKLEDMAFRLGVTRDTDIFVKNDDSVSRFCDSPELSFMEANLFRYKGKAYEGETKDIKLTECDTVQNEVVYCCQTVDRLVKEDKLHYRDIGVVMGDSETYGPLLMDEFTKRNIPYFVDKTFSVSGNALIIYIRTALNMVLCNFSYESVFDHLRCGLSPLTPEETDILDNYIRSTGIKGKKRWERLFAYKTKEMGESEEKLEAINALRSRVVEELTPLTEGKFTLVSHYVTALYKLFTENHIYDRLMEKSREFGERNMPELSSEYSRIYEYVCKLLEQTYSLIGEEECDLKEFIKILDAAIDEITVGIIPGTTDRVVCGDLERTRLNNVKTLLFLGINDNNIPKSVSNGGLISDMDREFLADCDVELAPTPRDKNFVQRLYLYLNLTKPSKKLFLSYANLGTDSKSLRPAYIVEMIKKLYPGLVCERFMGTDEKNLRTIGEVQSVFSGLIRRYALGEPENPDKEYEELVLKTKTLFKILVTSYDPGIKENAKLIKESAFIKGGKEWIEDSTAKLLYSDIIKNSVSRLQTFAGCAYRHFLAYGLKLRTGEEFDFEASDKGQTYHDVLEKFYAGLEDGKLDWRDFDDEFAAKLIDETVDSISATFNNGVLYSSGRNLYLIKVMKRILNRTVRTLKKQIEKGEFVPVAAEKGFNKKLDIEGTDKEFVLRGRIDRVDEAKEGEDIFVKITDYKSGHEDVDLSKLYYGLQLQLAVYMDAAMEWLGEKYKDKNVRPGAMLYYNIADPVYTDGKTYSDEEIEKSILKELKPKGAVNPEALEALDTGFKEGSGTYRSDVCVAARKADGSLGAGNYLTDEEFKLVLDYSDRIIKELAKEIEDGVIIKNPCKYEKDNYNACEYCAFRQVCGFDRNIPGYTVEELKSISDEEVLELMREDKPEDGDK